MKHRLYKVLGFAAGLMLTVGVILMSVTLSVLDQNRFAQALANNVDASLGVSDEEMAQFAADTIWYVAGWVDEWSPAVTMNGAPLVVPAAFSAHMAQVRGAVSVAKGACLVCLIGGMALMLYWLLKGQGAPKANEPAEKVYEPFPFWSYIAGMAVPFVLSLAACAWAALSFNGFWGWLHRTFIPNGIFAVDEPIMRLFPVGLFGDYLPSVALWLVCGLIAVLALAIVSRKDQKGKKAA